MNTKDTRCCRSVSCLPQSFDDIEWFWFHDISLADVANVMEDYGSLALVISTAYNKENRSFQGAHQNNLYIDTLVDAPQRAVILNTGII